MQAIVYWQRAGQRALERSAHIEAIGHLTQGLELLSMVSENPERTELELKLQTTLGPALMATKGFASPEVERVYARARELCGRLGETPELFSVLWGLYVSYAVRGEMGAAREMGEQCLVIAERTQNLGFRLEAHRALGFSLIFLGELTRGHVHLEQGTALYDPEQHRSHAFLYGESPGVVCLYLAAMTLWLLGYPDQALQRSQEAHTMARELLHPYSLAGALSFAAVVHQFRREGQTTRERAEAAIALSTEQGLPQYTVMGNILRGWALTQHGEEDEGLAQMHQGLAAWRAIGAGQGQTYWLALLAESHGKRGSEEEGLGALAQALEVVDRTGQRFYEAELRRLKGELLLKQNVADKDQVEACFHQALAIARRHEPEPPVQTTLSLA